MSANGRGHTDPNVSPDGRHLSFTGFDQGIEFHQALAVANADGPDQRDILPPSADIAIKHAWSPDSKRLVFTRDANPDPVSGVLAANVGTIRADGTLLRMLTHYTGGRLSAFAGSYSPDGRHIVIAADRHLVDSTPVGKAAELARSPASRPGRSTSNSALLDAARPRALGRWGVERCCGGATVSAS